MGRSLVLIAGMAAMSIAGAPVAPAPLSLTCGTFTPSTSAADLAKHFGAQNVRKGRVPWGGAEGDYNDGTVLFGDSPDAKVDIFWKDAANEREPEWVSASGTSSRWRTSGGIAIGAELKAVEKLNGRPFRLTGWGTDTQGSVMSWSGGRLDSQNLGACHIRIVFWTGDAQLSPAMLALERQVTGDRVFSSGHPAMQAINPTVRELVVTYGR